MPFGSLWLPVVVSAIAVFLISSVLHMVLKYHKADYQQLPGEDAIREAIGKVKPAPVATSQTPAAAAAQVGTISTAADAVTAPEPAVHELIPGKA